MACATGMASPLGGSITKKSDAESDSWKCSQEVSGVRGKQKMTDSPKKKLRLKSAKNNNMKILISGHGKATVGCQL